MDTNDFDSDSSTSSKSESTVLGSLDKRKRYVRSSKYSDHCSRHCVHQRACHACNAVLEAWWAGLPIEQQKAVAASEMLVNFATYGRQHYKGAGGGSYAGNGALRTKQDSPSYGDWSWKPGPGEEGRPEVWFREKLRVYVESLTKRQLAAYQAARAAAAENQQFRLSNEERVFAEQMQGLVDSTAHRGVDRAGRL